MSKSQKIRRGSNFRNVLSNCSKKRISWHAARTSVASTGVSNLIGLRRPRRISKKKQSETKPTYSMKQQSAVKSYKLRFASRLPTQIELHSGFASRKRI